MPEITIQHIIGTVTLLGLVISAGLFYTIFTSYVQDDNRKTQLKQISENMALNLAEMINIVKFELYSSNFSEYSVKLIDLPTSIGGEPYQIQLLDGSTPQVRSFLANHLSVSAYSTIPINSAGTSITLNTDPLVTQFTAADGTIISSSGTIYGKDGVAIWVLPYWSPQSGNMPDSVTIGIGWVTSQP